MKNFHINHRDISNIFWKKLFSYSSNMNPDKVSLLKFNENLDKLKNKATYKTGSINRTTQWALFSLAYFFEVKSIIEVGSYIGKSLSSLLHGSVKASLNNEDILAICCDKDNKITLPKFSKAKVHQFHKKTSTEMFKNIDKNIQFDLFHFDGRIQNEDIDYIKKFSHNESIYLFDDFEVVEKGVVNYSLMLENNIIDKTKYLIITPPNEIILKEFGFFEKCTTACVIPFSVIRFSTQ